MTILNSQQIAELCRGDAPMITPFLPGKFSEVAGQAVMSFGSEPMGYTIRAAPGGWSTPKPGEMIDPKFHNPRQWFDLPERDGRVWIPPNSIALCHSVESFIMPPDVMALCVTKSTYARVGGFANVTPLEPAWRGVLTIEIANLSAAYACVYTREGVGQLVFLRASDAPSLRYTGAYQNQPAQTVHAGERK